MPAKPARRRVRGRSSRSRCSWEGPSSMTPPGCRAMAQLRGGGVRGPGMGSTGGTTAVCPSPSAPSRQQRRKPDSAPGWKRAKRPRRQRTSASGRPGAVQVAGTGSDSAPARRLNVAEGVGFEPTGPLRAQRFSRPPHSTALPPFRWGLGSRSRRARPESGVTDRGEGRRGLFPRARRSCSFAGDRAVRARDPGDPPCGRS